MATSAMEKAKFRNEFKFSPRDIGNGFLFHPLPDGEMFTNHGWLTDRQSTAPCKPF